jgi:hypothetical protein
MQATKILSTNELYPLLYFSDLLLLLFCLWIVSLGRPHVTPQLPIAVTASKFSLSSFRYYLSLNQSREKPTSGFLGLLVLSDFRDCTHFEVFAKANLLIEWCKILEVSNTFKSYVLLEFLWYLQLIIITSVKLSPYRIESPIRSS